MKNSQKIKNNKFFYQKSKVKNQLMMLKVLFCNLNKLKIIELNYKVNKLIKQFKIENNN